MANAQLYSLCKDLFAVSSRDRKGKRQSYINGPTASRLADKHEILWRFPGPEIFIQWISGHQPGRLVGDDVVQIRLSDIHKCHCCSGRGCRRTCFIPNFLDEQVSGGNRLVSFADHAICARNSRRGDVCGGKHACDVLDTELQTDDNVEEPHKEERMLHDLNGERITGLLGKFPVSLILEQRRQTEEIACNYAVHGWRGGFCASFQTEKRTRHTWCQSRRCRIVARGRRRVWTRGQEVGIEVFWRTTVSIRRALRLLKENLRCNCSAICR